MFNRKKGICILNTDVTGSPLLWRRNAQGALNHAALLGILLSFLVTAILSRSVLWELLTPSESRLGLEVLERRRIVEYPQEHHRKNGINFLEQRQGFLGSESHIMNF